MSERTVDWSDSSKHRYESGLDRGMVYRTDTNLGVRWPGLKAVNVSESGSELEPIYYEGRVSGYFLRPGNTHASVEAFTYPDDFLPSFGGEESLWNDSGAYGVTYDREAFHFSWRTKSDSPLSDEEDYTLHIIYNAMANPAAEDYTTVGDDTEPMTFSWDVETFPMRSSHLPQPTSRIKLHSREISPYQMALIEDILYGSYNTGAPAVATPDHLEDILTLTPNVQMTNIVPYGNFEGSAPSYGSPGGSTPPTWSNGYRTIRGNRSLSFSTASAYVTFPNNSFGLTLVSNRWVFGSYKIRLAADAPNVDAGRFGIMANGAVWYSPQIPSRTAGIHTVLIPPRTVPNGTNSTLALRFDGGYGVKMLLDDICLVEFTSEAECREKYDLFTRLEDPYFDGSTKYKGRGYGSWLGTVNSSRSTFRSFGVPGGIKYPLPQYPLSPDW